MAEEKKSYGSGCVVNCLKVVILCAIAGILINECQRSEIRLENDKRKYYQNIIQDNTPTNHIIQWRKARNISH